MIQQAKRLGNPLRHRGPSVWRKRRAGSQELILGISFQKQVNQSSRVESSVGSSDKESPFLSVVFANFIQPRENCKGCHQRLIVSSLCG